MLIEVLYKPSFVRQFNTLEPALQEEVYEILERFKHPEQHKSLRVHKLKGSLSGWYSFSINYRYRIVFMWETKNKKSATLLAIGDHGVYR